MTSMTVAPAYSSQKVSFTLCLGVWVSDIYFSTVCQLSRDRRGYKSLFYILDLAMGF